MQAIQTIEEGNRVRLSHRGQSAVVTVDSITDDGRIVTFHHPVAGRLVCIQTENGMIAVDTGATVVGPALGEIEVVG